MAEHGTKISAINAQKVIATVMSVLIAATGIIIASLTAYPAVDISADAAQENSAYIVLETSTLRILKGQNIATRLPMASTTKAMTALVVLENANIDDVVTIPKSAVGIEGSSIYLRGGEHLTVKDLLYGLMLRSGNDAATALALYIAGSIDSFAVKMNEKVAQLGLNNTHFVNPHGLSAKGHYTSAYDLAVIAATALKNPIFREIVSTKFITIESRDGAEPRYFANKNKILYNYDGATGIKTGYTTEAGRCLIASSLRNGMEVVAVALNYYEYFDLCASLMDYAHQNYVLTPIIDKNKCYAEIKVNKNRKIKSVELHPTESIYYPLKRDGSENVTAEVETIGEITAPHSHDKPCGEVKIFMDNRLLFTEKLYTIYDIEKRKLF